MLLVSWELADRLLRCITSASPWHHTEALHACRKSCNFLTSDCWFKYKGTSRNGGGACRQAPGLHIQVWLCMQV